MYNFQKLFTYTKQKYDFSPQSQRIKFFKLNLPFRGFKPKKFDVRDISLLFLDVEKLYKINLAIRFASFNAENCSICKNYEKQKVA